MDFVIRPARYEELDTVGELTAQAYLADDLVSDGSGYVEQLRRARHRAQHTEMLVAADRSTGTVVGSVSFVRWGSEYADLAREGEAEFRMLAVSPGARRRGVAEALVRACLDRARAIGAERVVICSSVAMRAAHRLYDRLGFVRIPERDWSPLPGVELIGSGYELAAE
jgi:ribosomal protein S18 acetylase RimI-like enzyme